MLKIDIDSCIGCGVCESTCTFGAIKVVDGLAVVGDKCTLCGSCVDACEIGALSIEREEKAVASDLDSWSGVWVFAESRDGRCWESAGSWPISEGCRWRRCCLVPGWTGRPGN